MDHRHRFSPWRLQIDEIPILKRIYMNCFQKEEYRYSYTCMSNDQFESKKYFEWFWNLELHERIVDHLGEVTDDMSKNQEMVFFSAQKPPSIVLGVDQFGFGWNLIGRGLQKKRNEVDKERLYAAFMVIQVLKKWILEEGKSLEIFWDKDPTIILKYMDRVEGSRVEEVWIEFQNRRLVDWEVIQMWIDYPHASLIMMVEHKYCRFVWNEYQKKIVSWLWDEQPDTIRRCQQMDENLLYLYTTHRLPITSRFIEKRRKWENESDYKKHPDLLQKMVDFTPSRFPLHARKITVMDEDSPFCMKGCMIKGDSYRCIMEYVYTKILEPYIGVELSKKKISRLSLEKMQHFPTFRHILDWSVNRFIRLQIRKHIGDIMKKNEELCLFLSDKDEIRYADPYDFFVGYHKDSKNSNQWGRELVRAFRLLEKKKS